MEYDNPVKILADLVNALDNTYWYSWQSTAKFYKGARIISVTYN